MNNELILERQLVLKLAELKEDYINSYVVNWSGPDYAINVVKALNQCIQQLKEIVNAPEQLRP